MNPSYFVINLLEDIAQMDGTLPVGTVPNRHLDQIYVPYLFPEELWLLAAMFSSKQIVTMVQTMNDFGF